MPQLDKVTFLSQFFWLAFFYLAFYFIVLKFFLPKLTRVLKVRNQKMSGAKKGFKNLLQELGKVNLLYDTRIFSGSTVTNSSMQETSQESKNWLDFVEEVTNNTNNQKINKDFLESFIENELKDKKISFQSFFPYLEKGYGSFLLLKL